MICEKKSQKKLVLFYLPQAAQLSLIKRSYLHPSYYCQFNIVFTNMSNLFRFRMAHCKMGRNRGKGENKLSVCIPIANGGHSIFQWCLSGYYGFIVEHVLNMSSWEINIGTNMSLHPSTTVWGACSRLWTGDIPPKLCMPCHGLSNLVPAAIQCFIWETKWNLLGNIDVFAT
jgi:hypothetical protein